MVSPLEIEVKVASRALQFASELGFDQVIVEGDCQVLTNALIEDKSFLSTVGVIIDDICFEASCYNQLRYSLVKREGNKVAHSLVRYAIEILDFVVWMEDVPPHLLSVVQVDIVGFHY